MIPLCRQNDCLILMLDVDSDFGHPGSVTVRRLHEQLARLTVAAQTLRLPMLRSDIGSADKATDGLFLRDTFSACGQPNLLNHLAGLHKRQVALCGTATHTGILHTALELQKQGFEVFLVADACASPHEFDHQMALQRLHRQGVTITTTATLIHEWLGSQAHPHYKALSDIPG